MMDLAAAKAYVIPLGKHAGRTLQSVADGPDRKDLEVILEASREAGLVGQDDLAEAIEFVLSNIPAKLWASPDEETDDDLNPEEEPDVDDDD